MTGSGGAHRVVFIAVAKEQMARLARSLKRDELAWFEKIATQLAEAPEAMSTELTGSLRGFRSVRERRHCIIVRVSTATRTVYVVGVGITPLAIEDLRAAVLRGDVSASRLL